MSRHPERQQPARSYGATVIVEEREGYKAMDADTGRPAPLSGRRLRG
ncbi:MULTISPECIES: hypothetical protein [unclassified Streptomyces]|nr:hypothetical protein [Streptomyces sp. 303MFCol5.2]